MKVVDVLDKAEAKALEGFAGSQATKGRFWTRWAIHTWVWDCTTGR